MGAGLARALTPEAQLAEAFLATLDDARAPWAERFEIWADEHGLGPDARHAVKLTVLRMRMFGAMERHARRGRR